MAKIAVVAAPEMLPPELMDNPDVVVIDPSTVPDEAMSALDEASGGLLMGADEGAPPPEGEEGGEGPLEDWAKEEEAEPEHSGEGDDEDKDRDSVPPDGSGYGGEDEDGFPPSGEGDDGDEDEEKDKVAASGSRGRGRSGRGPSPKRSPLAAWAGRR